MGGVSGREGWQEADVSELLWPTAILCLAERCPGWSRPLLLGTPTGDAEVWCRTEIQSQSWD